MRPSAPKKTAYVPKNTPRNFFCQNHSTLFIDFFTNVYLINSCRIVIGPIKTNLTEQNYNFRISLQSLLYPNSVACVTPWSQIINSQEENMGSYPCQKNFLIKLKSLLMHQVTAYDRGVATLFEGVNNKSLK